MSTRRAKAGKSAADALKIATFNVNGINGRLGVLLRWLAEAEPDIVCLQELKSPQDKFPTAKLEAAGYTAAWKGQSRWNGVAILSRGKAPIVTRERLPGDANDDQSRYIEAAVSGILICCLYAPNGNPAPGPKFDYKLKWLDRLLAHTVSLLETGAPVVLAGDFNIIPSQVDVYKPERWEDDALFRAEARDAYRRLLGQGWLDAIRTLHPDQPMYTFWDYFGNAWGRDAGLRLDHLLLSPNLRSRVREANVDRFVRCWEKASDHAPAWTSLQVSFLLRHSRKSPVDNVISLEQSDVPNRATSISRPRRSAQSLPKLSNTASLAFKGVPVGSPTSKRESHWRPAQ